MPLSEHARRYLLDEGIRPETIIKTGSPMAEVLKHYTDKINASNILEQEGLKPGDYILLSTHREENVDSSENFENLLDSLNAITKNFNKKVIISLHPRTRKKLEEMNYITNNALVSFSKPFGFPEYIKLQQNAFCVISDSGTITEESSILGFPAITIRQAHERPEGMDEGTIIMTGLKADRIIDSINVVTNQYNNQKWKPAVVKDYEYTDVSKKVVRIILSYTDYINRTVWHKE